jgi:replicative DNA helicase
MSQEAERIVLAGLIRAPELNAKHAKRMLKASDFAWPHHAWLFDSCLWIWKDAKATPIRLDLLYQIAERRRIIHAARVRIRDAEAGLIQV